MREFTCVVCGKKGIDNSLQHTKKYCSQECANKARYCMRSEETCQHNDGVMCARKKCSKCGWNPEVEKIRKEKLEKEHGDGK